MQTGKKLTKGREFCHKNIIIKHHGKQLSMSNGYCERVVDLSRNYPSTCSLKNSDGNEFATASERMDFSFIGINLPTSDAVTEYEINGIRASLSEDTRFDTEFVRVTITVTEKVQQVTFVRSYLIFSELPVLGVENSIHCKVTPNITWNYRMGIDAKRQYPVENTESCVDCFQLARSVAVVKAVEFRGRTDYNNELVIEHKPVRGAVNGNILFCENYDSGIFILQEAPPSSERRDFESHDFRIDNDDHLFSCGWGIDQRELNPEETFVSYRHIIGFYAKGEEQLELKRYLKRRFPINPAKDHTVMVNPWGVGKFPQLVNEKFLQAEIAAAADLGATHYQIDDGWQSGKSLGEIILNNRYVTPEFWTISEQQLPHGFEKLHAAARQNGIELALWVAPSCNQEYRDWQIMADILFEFYQKYQIRIFKIDAVLIQTKRAENNLRALVQNLRERSQGDIIFNFDTTNGIRPGYFMFLEYGNIFLENRYVYGAGLGYHPEDTLRSLWQLGQYMRLQSLQIEIPSHDDINQDFYAERGNIQPYHYPAEYWAAIALFANPLLWLAPSRISQKLMHQYRTIIDIHLQYRDAIFAGDIFPIGQEPNGSALTGFISHNPTADSGFILLFREMNGQKSLHCDIPQLSRRPYRFNKIYESYTTFFQQNDGVRCYIRMERLGSFCLLEYH